MSSSTFLPTHEATAKYSLQDIGRMMFDLRARVVNHEKTVMSNCFDHETFMRQQSQINKSMDERLAKLLTAVENLNRAPASPLPQPAATRGWQLPAAVTTKPIAYDTDAWPKLKLDPPRFDGDNVTHWITRIQTFYNHSFTPLADRLYLTQFLLDDAAADWFNYWEANNNGKSWDDFLVDIKVRFDQDLYEDNVGQLAALHQRGRLPPTPQSHAVQASSTRSSDNRDAKQLHKYIPPHSRSPCSIPSVAIPVIPPMTRNKGESINAPQTEPKTSEEEEDDGSSVDSASQESDVETDLMQTQTPANPKPPPPPQPQEPYSSSREEVSQSDIESEPDDAPTMKARPLASEPGVEKQKVNDGVRLLNKIRRLQKKYENNTSNVEAEKVSGPNAVSNFRISAPLRETLTINLKNGPISKHSKRKRKEVLLSDIGGAVFRVSSALGITNGAKGRRSDRDARRKDVRFGSSGVAAQRQFELHKRNGFIFENGGRKSIRIIYWYLHYMQLSVGDSSHLMDVINHGSLVEDVLIIGRGAALLDGVVEKHAMAATWAPSQLESALWFRADFPHPHLEDKVLSIGGGVDTGLNMDYDIDSAQPASEAGQRNSPIEPTIQDPPALENLMHARKRSKLTRYKDFIP